MVVRKARFVEGPILAAWLLANKDRNSLDPDVLDYPRAEVLVACEGEVPVAVMPVHAVVMLESMGYRPGTPAKDMVNAVDALIDSATSIATSAQMKELVFLSSDPEVDRAAERRGFERFVCYRRKLK